MFLRSSCLVVLSTMSPEICMAAAQTGVYRISICMMAINKSPTATHLKMEIRHVCINHYFYPPMPIGLRGIYRLPYVCNFVRRIFCKGYSRRGIYPKKTLGDEIWQDVRSGWVAGFLPFGELWPKG